MTAAVQLQSGPQQLLAQSTADPPGPQPASTSSAAS